MSSEPTWHSTTILAVKKGRKLVIMGDGQVSMGQTIMKGNARKVRRLGKGDVIAGFASGAAWLTACILSAELARGRQRRPH